MPNKKQLILTTIIGELKLRAQDRLVLENKLRDESPLDYLEVEEPVCLLIPQVCKMSQTKVNVSLMVHLSSAFPFGILKSTYINNYMAEINRIDIKIWSGHI